MLTCERCREAWDPPDELYDDVWVCPNCRTREEAIEDTKTDARLEFMVRHWERTNPTFGAHMRELIELRDEYRAKADDA